MIMNQCGLDPDQGADFRMVKRKGPHMKCGPFVSSLTLLIQYTKWSETQQLPIFKMEVVVGMVVSEISTDLGA